MHLEILVFAGSEHATSSAASGLTFFLKKINKFQFVFEKKIVFIFFVFVFSFSFLINKIVFFFFVFFPFSFLIKIEKQLKLL